MVLAGDSAGGYLACAVSGLIHFNKLQHADMISLFYPAMRMEQNYTPSMF